MKIVNLIIKAVLRLINSFKVAAIVFAGMVFFGVLGFEVLAIVWAFACYAVIAYRSCNKIKKIEAKMSECSIEMG